MSSCGFHLFTVTFTLSPTRSHHSEIFFVKQWKDLASQILYKTITQLEAQTIQGCESFNTACLEFLVIRLLIASLGFQMFKQIKNINIEQS